MRISNRFTSIFKIIELPPDFFSGRFLMCSVRENCRETANERIKMRKCVFTKKMQPMQESGADLYGEGEVRQRFTEKCFLASRNRLYRF